MICSHINKSNFILQSRHLSKPKLESQNLSSNRITIVKGHEHKLYEALQVIVGPFFKFTIVKMKGPNKPLNQFKKSYVTIAFI